MGDHLAYRYQILALLGRGSFGQVPTCLRRRRFAIEKWRGF